LGEAFCEGFETSANSIFDQPETARDVSSLAFVSVKEGFGLAAMEALAAGVPVVARDLPVLHEVLAGQAPDPEAGVALVQGYRWDAVAAQHEDFYRQVHVAGQAARAGAG
jgi:hypothetical protein